MIFQHHVVRKSCQALPRIIITFEYAKWLFTRRTRSRIDSTTKILVLIAVRLINPLVSLVRLDKLSAEVVGTQQRKVLVGYSSQCRYRVSGCFLKPQKVVGRTDPLGHLQRNQIAEQPKESTCSQLQSHQFMANGRFFPKKGILPSSDKGK